MTRSQQFLELNNGTQVPLPAYGVGTKWQHLKKGRAGDEQGTLDDNLADAVARAIKLGFRHIDTAEVYTTGPEVAEGIKRSGVKRDDIFITGKYNAGFKFNGAAYPAGSQNTYESVLKALKELDTDYIDLFLLHHQWIDLELSHGNTIEKAWADLERALEEGKVKNIGLSNFDSANIQRVLKVAKVKPQILQIEFHPYLYNQSPKIHDFAKEHGILVEAYGPLSPIFRTSQDAPLSPVLKDLSEKYGKTEAQILLRWVYQNGVLPITTSSQDDRIVDALETFNDDWKLTEDDVALISEIGSKFKFRGFFEDFDKTD